MSVTWLSFKAGRLMLPLYMEYICKLTNYFLYPRFSYYLQAKTSINKKPVLLIFENSQFILVEIISPRISTYVVKVILQLNSWIKIFIPFEVELNKRKSDFPWGISFNKSLVLTDCFLSISPLNFLLVSSQFLLNEFMTFRLTWITASLYVWEGV